MKKLLLILILFSMLCAKAQENKYVLDVHIEQNGKVDKPSFLIIDTEGHRFVITQVQDSQYTFVLDTALSYPHPISIHYYFDVGPEEAGILKNYGGFDKQHPSLYFFMTEGTTIVKINSDTILFAKPDLVQKRFLQLQNEIDSRIDSFNLTTGNPLFEEFKHANTQKEKDSIEELKDVLFKVNTARLNLDSSLMPAIQNNADNSLSLYAVSEYVRVARLLNLEINKNRLTTLMDALSPKQKSFHVWTDLYNNIRAIPDVQTLVGDFAPEFEALLNTSGKEVHLSDFRGKVLFVDFWASWCGPCIKQLPELKRIYEKLNKDKVEFIGISLDFNSRNWKKEILDSGLKWINVSDLKSGNGITSLRYNVTTIPHNVLINMNGLVIAENIPIDKLETEISNSL